MGKKGKWFDAVQRILSTSEPDPVEADAKVNFNSPKKIIIRSMPTRKILISYYFHDRFKFDA